MRQPVLCLNYRHEPINLSEVFDEASQRSVTTFAESAKFIAKFRIEIRPISMPELQAVEAMEAEIYCPPPHALGAELGP